MIFTEKHTACDFKIPVLETTGSEAYDAALL